jgi:L-2-hydroxycarboxylate dehydrogenase (NAD+)
LIKGTCYLPVVTARQFMADVFIALGVLPEDAAIASEVLITADLWGIESHGIGRLRYYYDRLKRGQHKPVTHFEVVRDGPATALVDGNHGMGQVIGVKAMQMAIDKARECGMGSVAVRNSTHYGIAGYYAMMAVKAGMIGLSCTNARPSVAPTFSVHPMLGTNPIAFGAPTDVADCPFLFDAATSVVQRGTYEVLEREGLHGEADWAIGPDGNSPVDPAVVIRGLEAGKVALYPLGGKGEILGGHKGYGLSTMVEILSAALQGGAFLYGLIGFDESGRRQPYRVGHFFMAIDIRRFIPLEEFERTTGTILRQLRSAPKAAGCTRIYTAGEKEAESVESVRENGIPIVPALQEELRFMQTDLELAQYQFNF